MPDSSATASAGRTRRPAYLPNLPERYGPGLIRLALNILEKRHVPPAVFISHALITPENVDHYYPNDSLVTGEELDSMMLRKYA